jgi:hypothetical protein
MGGLFLPSRLLIKAGISKLEFRLDSRKRLSSAEFIKHKLPG